MTLVFTYGTLMTGMPNNRVIKQRGNRCLGPAMAHGGWRLLDLGAYPGLIDSDEPGVIAGELWEVDDLTMADLDRLECVPWLYQRCTVEVLVGDKRLTAVAYVYNQRGNDRDQPLVPGNDWRVHREASRGEMMT
jgi:gamma-glutamylcyclotransferase (GGCT)/AIG2-like uncharacterized protein YtfP